MAADLHAAPPAAFDEAAAERGHVVELGGIRTRYHEAGSGRALLLLHGSGPGVSAWTNWRGVLPALAQRFRVIAPDQVGFGGTAPSPDGAYGRARWTDHALALIAALGIEELDVVGNSMGGAVALSLAARRPAAVGRVVAMGTAGARMELPPGLERVWGYEPSLEAMRDVLELFATDSSRITDDLVELRYRSSTQPGIHEAYRAMFPPPRQHRLDDLALTREELAAIRQPVLLVHGSDDEVVPFVPAAMPLLRELPHARAYVFGGCGHWAMIEHAAEFTDVVCRFLAGDDDGAGR